MGKRDLPKITEPDENMVHYASYFMQDAVTLCGKTDFIGETAGEATSDPVTCNGCRNLANWIHKHRKPAHVG